MNVSLTPELEEFINKKVAGGMYVTASEVVREALRVLKNQDDYLEQRKAKLAAEIEKAWEQLERGEVVDGESVFAELRRRSAEMRRKSA